MLRFKRLNYVKIKPEYIKEDLPSGTLVVSNIIELDDGERGYELMDMLTLRKYVGISDDWLEQTEKPVRLSISGEEIKIFSGQEEKKTVSILGTTYTIIEKHLKDVDGYCDKTTKEIAVAAKEDDCDLGNFEEYRKKVLRHEITHAYFFESGLAECFENIKWGIPETLVDWFAYQSPKIFKTFEELNIL